MLENVVSNCTSGGGGVRVACEEASTGNLITKGLVTGFLQLMIIIIILYFDFGMEIMKLDT